MNFMGVVDGILSVIKKGTYRFTRREFLGLAGVTGMSLAAGVPAFGIADRGFDLVVANGRLIDPASNTDAVMNVGIRRGKIAAVSREQLAGGRVINAKGMVVSPGFIDVHSHADGIPRAGEFSARMGATTLIGGNCGSSDALDSKHGSDLGTGVLLDRFDREGYPVNHAMFIGASDIREKALGCSRYEALPRDRIKKMTAIAAQALDRGAIGISFGLEYSPGTTEEELIALFKTARRKGAVCAVHPRNSGRGLMFVLGNALDAYKELAAVTRKSGAMLEVSHLGAQIAWRSDPYDDLTRSCLEVISDARKEGLNVLGDAHPYTAWCTSAGGAALDPFLKGKAMMWVLEKRFFVNIGMLEAGGGPHCGERLTQKLLKEIRKKAPDTPVIGHTMRQDLVEMIYRDPMVMVASDAVYDLKTGLPPHPRGAGTFPKVLGEFVREKKILTLNEAVRKMTVMPADRFSLSKKGRIAKGVDADIVIFDPATVADGATYSEPVRFPKGIDYVIVNGIPVVDGGKLRNVKPGRAVRPKA